LTVLQALFASTKSDDATKTLSDETSHSLNNDDDAGGVRTAAKFNHRVSTTNSHSIPVNNNHVELFNEVGSENTTFGDSSFPFIWHAGVDEATLSTSTAEETKVASYSPSIDDNADVTLGSSMKYSMRMVLVLVPSFLGDIKDGRYEDVIIPILLVVLAYVSVCLCHSCVEPERPRLTFHLSCNKKKQIEKLHKSREASIEDTQLCTERGQRGGIMRNSLPDSSEQQHEDKTTEDKTNNTDAGSDKRPESARRFSKCFVFVFVLAAAAAGGVWYYVGGVNQPPLNSAASDEKHADLLHLFSLPVEGARSLALALDSALIDIDVNGSREDASTPGGADEGGGTGTWLGCFV